MLVLLLSLVAVTNASTQSPAPTVPAGSGSVAGRIFESGTARPLPNVIVSLIEAQTGGILKTTTGGDGRYVFEGIGAGGYRITASLAGYAEQEFIPRAADGPVRWQPDEVRVLPNGGKVSGGIRWLGLAAGQARTDIDIVLTRGAVISGRVTKADGQPVKDAFVRALRMLEDGGFTFSGRTQVRSNDRGEYTIADLAPGLYRISAAWYDPARRKARAPLDPRPTYFPGTGVPDEALSLSVTPGAALSNIDIRLAPDDLFRLAGHVLRGLSEGRIEAHLASGSSSTRTVDVTDEGAFDVTHLPAGRHSFWARAATPAGWEAAWTTIDLGSDMTGLVLPMTPTGAIRGRVVSTDGAELSGEQIIAEWIDADGKPLDVLPRDRTDIAGDGTFELSGLFGDRRLRISGGDWVVDRVLMENDPVDRLAMDSGARLEKIIVVVKRR